MKTQRKFILKNAQLAIIVAREIKHLAHKALTVQQTRLQDKRYLTVSCVPMDFTALILEQLNLFLAQLENVKMDHLPIILLPVLMDIYVKMEKKSSVLLDNTLIAQISV